MGKVKTTVQSAFEHCHKVTYENLFGSIVIKLNNAKSKLFQFTNIDCGIIRNQLPHSIR